MFDFVAIDTTVRTVVYRHAYSRFGALSLDLRAPTDSRALSSTLLPINEARKVWYTSRISGPSNQP